MRDNEINTFVSFFGPKLNQILITNFDNKYDESSPSDGLNLFIDSLRAISQDLFKQYNQFCEYIDYGMQKFNDQDKVRIVGSQGIKRTLFTCTDSVPFLSRYVDNTPIDRNGNISVKTEEGLWGLITQTGETILHPQFFAVSINPIDRTGKTYLVKNANGDFFSVNLETNQYTKLAKK